MTDATLPKPVITRVRHELKRRTLTVARVEPLPANLVRVVLEGAELQGFTSLGFDDHIKLFFPRPEGPADAAPEMRDFTPRRFDAATGELWIDFFLHDGGPATSWAAQASVGQTLHIAGPKGSSIIAIEGIATHLLIGDETALPAISRRLEELPSGTRAIAVVQLDTGAERPVLKSRATLEVALVNRVGHDGSAQGVINALDALRITPDRCFAWVAGESRTARAIRLHLHAALGFSKGWTKAAGYWQLGAAGKHDSIADES